MDNTNARLQRQDFIAENERLSWDNASLRARVERLEAALREYADEDNWGLVADYDPDTFYWAGKHPYAIARRALADD